ncbi:DUF1289 domain-containing protein [Parashewanella spongiae]|uniref:DUF1289 domain-containing protein n=1 Tax=Parashewanella spongiae TaxID=342950 RepID=A0A3A6TR29_9GAMM|nr:DUF1289 domain-containing protein [Parashewanella spongiae]MCL1079501.1 DUF1289 domain-containing protein [Parashewanella spongiae]RJY07513.1 DUF1289 domain-containing protein [Parashewanella spongiae]
MEQLEFFDVPSPCISVCQTDSRGYCLGCFRSRDERFQWQQFTLAKKVDVIRLCKQRKRRYRYAIYQAQRTTQQELDLNTSFDFD